MKLPAWSIVLIFLAGGAWCRDADEPQPPYHAARQREVHIRHYKLILSLDFGAKRCAGEVAITFSPLYSGLDTLRLDAAYLHVMKAQSGKRNLDFRTVGDSLVIALGKSYRPRDSATVVITYEVTDPKKGMYFISPDSGYPSKQFQVWTQGEPEDNHYWFPCYDFPNDFSTSEAIVTVPESCTVVSNGALVDVRHDSSEKKVTWHWLERKPHVSYLISLVAGSYVEVKGSWKGVPVSSFVYPSQRDMANISFGKTPRMIGLFSDKAGIPYPWEKFSQTVVEDFIFGGEENVTAVTLNDGTIHDARADLDYSSDPLVAHELAHMWWGDLVTCRDWSQAWLNEGFATFFENIFMEEERGRDDAEKELRDTQSSITVTDTGTRRRPTVCARYNAPIELFDSRIYGKGACILSMLRHQLGEDLFWKSLRRFLRDHEFGNVETSDLETAIRETTGSDYHWFFDEWVYKAGFPEFEVSWTWDAARQSAILAVKQTQQMDSLTGIFRTPVDVEVWTGGKPKTWTVTVDSRQQQFALPAAQKPDLVLFDKGNMILKRVETQKPVDEWLYQLRHAEHGVDRTIAIGNLHWDVDTPRVAQALEETMLHDPFWNNRRDAAFTLSSQNHPLPVRGMLEASRDRDSRVRAAVMSALAQYRTDPAVLQALRSAFRDDPSYSVGASALAVLAEIDSTRALAWCREGLQRDSYKEVIRNAALNAFAETGGDSAFQDVMNFTRYGVNRDLRISALWVLSRAWKEKPEVVRRCIELIHDPAFSVRRSIMEILGSLKAQSALEPLREAAQAETDGRIVELAKRAIQAIEGH